ncbi:MAG: hypothetical protein ABI333_13500 [bacterium]
MRAQPFLRTRTLAIFLLLASMPKGVAPAGAAPATPLQAPAPAVHLHTGAFLLVPPGDAPQSRVWAAVAFQIGSTNTQGWGEVTSSRGGLIVGGEWAIPGAHGLALGGSLVALELLDDHVYVPPAIDEHHTRVDLGVTRLYLRYLIGDSATARGRWMPRSNSLSSQLGVYVRGTIPTATSVLSDQRHPRPPLRDALGDGVNDMNWGALEVGLSLGLVVAKWYSMWVAYTPLALAITGGDPDLVFLTAVHLTNVVRLPMRLPGNGAFELVVELVGHFRFTDPRAYFGLHPGLRYQLPKWSIAVGSKIGLGHWVELGDRYTVGLELSRRF